MPRRHPVIAALVALSGVLSGAWLVASPSPVAAAEVNVVLDGHGNGHGVGLSQWGAYGYAVDHGWTSAQILDHYYGGTVAGTVPLTTMIRVRLQNLDGAQTALAVDDGALQVTGLAGGPWKSVLLRETATPNQYAVWARADVVRCPAAAADPVTAGWTLVHAGLAGPVDVRTQADSSAVTAVTQLISSCEPNGTVRWYRGTIRALNDASGNNRTVNELPMEQYLRTVIAMEMSPGWADDGGGRGAQALQAQAVAARSYALAYKWYPYAEVCDMVCQSYFGVAFRTATGTLRQVESAPTDAAVAATAGVVRRVGNTSGAIALTMFSASNGGHTAPGTSALMPFPAVPDEGDDTALNPNHDWSVTLPGSAIAARYPAIGTFTGLTVTARNGYGEWGGRVTTLRVVGTSGFVDVTGAAFRTAMGLKDTWFNVRGAAVPPPSDPCAGRLAPAVTGSMPAPTGARFTSITPLRLVDTRNGTGTAKLPLGAGCTLVVDPNLDPSVTAVAVNLTSVKPLKSGSVTAYACGVNRPQASAVQAVAGRVVAGTAIVPLGADGTFCVYTANATELLVDLFGSYAPTNGVKFQPVAAARLYDSRNRTTPLPAGTTLRVKVAGTAAVPVGATAAALTVHATGALADGHLTVYPCTATRPGVSSLNATKGIGITNHVEVGLSAAGEVCVYLATGMHVTVDVSGWYGAAATTQYFAVQPVRVVDTRNGTGLVGGFAAGANRAVVLAGVAGLPTAATLKSVMAQVTAVGPASAGYLTVHPCLATVPSVSMVRFTTGANAATSVAGIDDASGRWCIAASTATHVLVDVNGWFA